MDELMEIVKTLGSCVSKMTDKLKLGKDLLPNNMIVKSVENLIGKKKGMMLPL